MRRLVHPRLTGLIGALGLVASCALNPQPEPPMATLDTTSGAGGSTGLGGESRGTGGSYVSGGGAGGATGFGGSGQAADGGTLPLAADAAAEAGAADGGASDGEPTDGGSPEPDASTDAATER
jgi:hypothetical protein